MSDIEIKFLKTYTVNGVDGVTYQEGSIHSLPESSANHFLKRKIACLVSETAAPEPAAPIAQADEREIGSGDIDLGALLEADRTRQGIIEPARRMPPNIPASWAISENPLVSCIMPTADRAEFIPAAIDCWLKQTYPNRELIILDDGPSIKRLIPKNKSIRYVRPAEKIVLGDKRNKACDIAQGEIICHFDDDDWSAPERIADQVERLKQTGKPITGYGTLYFWDIQNQKAKRYVSGSAGYVTGTSLCYLKAYWQKNQFPSREAQEDNGFVYRAVRLIAASHDARFMVARIHGKQTVSKANTGVEVSRDLFPAGFWESEEIRLKSGKK